MWLIIKNRNIQTINTYIRYRHIYISIVYNISPGKNISYIYTHNYIKLYI